MPTYKNNLNEPIYVKDPNGNDVPFGALETKTTYLILSDARITKTSSQPYYNPMLDADQVTLATSAASASYTCEPEARYIHLYPVAGTPRVYINNMENLPGIILYESMTLTNKGKIENLYFDNFGTDAATVDIKEVM
jgi:hypothetical protein